MALLLGKRVVEGYYSLHLKSNRYKSLTQLGDTDMKISVRPTSVKDMNVRLLGGTDITFSVRLKCNG
jgi:hypothetical protein